MNNVRLAAIIFFVPLFSYASPEQIPCGEKDGIALPCWTNYLGPKEGVESLPLYPYAKRPNGCSIPGSTPGIHDHFVIAKYEFNFRSSCLAHDRCYYTPGAVATECNAELTANLRQACNDGVASAQWFEDGDIHTEDSRSYAFSQCMARARTVWTAVSVGADMVFPRSQAIEQDYLVRVDAYVDSHRP